MAEKVYGIWLGGANRWQIDKNGCIIHSAHLGVIEALSDQQGYYGKDYHPVSVEIIGEDGRPEKEAKKPPTWEETASGVRGLCEPEGPKTPRPEPPPHGHVIPPEPPDADSFCQGHTNWRCRACEDTNRVKCFVCGRVRGGPP